MLVIKLKKVTAHAEGSLNVLELYIALEIYELHVLLMMWAWKLSSALS